jgi:hypothetical protein
MSVVLLRTARARSRTFLAASTVVMLVLIGVAALFAGQITAGLTRTNAQVSGAREAELLVTVGADFPQLSASAITHTLTPADEGRLDAAVKRVQHNGLLTSLVIWDRAGRLAYSSLGGAEGNAPPQDPGLGAALAGRTTTILHPHELNPSSGKRSGLLDLFEPLTNQHGLIYGVLEASLPLKPRSDWTFV